MRTPRVPSGSDCLPDAPGALTFLDLPDDILSRLIALLWEKDEEEKGNSDAVGALRCTCRRLEALARELDDAFRVVRITGPMSCAAFRQRLERVCDFRGRVVLRSLPELDASWLAPLTRPCQARELVVKHVGQCGDAELAALVRLFPAVESLVLRPVQLERIRDLPWKVNRPNAAGIAALRNLTALTRLCIDGDVECPHSEHCEWFAALRMALSLAQPPLALQALEWRNGLAADHPQLSDEAVPPPLPGGSLCSLTLALSGAEPDASFWRALAQAFPQLQHVYWHDADGVPARLHPLQLAALGSLPLHTLAAHAAPDDLAPLPAVQALRMLHLDPVALPTLRAALPSLHSLRLGSSLRAQSALAGLRVLHVHTLTVASDADLAALRALATGLHEFRGALQCEAAGDPVCFPRLRTADLHRLRTAVRLSLPVVRRLAVQQCEEPAWRLDVAATAPVRQLRIAPPAPAVPASLLAACRVGTLLELGLRVDGQDRDAVRELQRLVPALHRLDLWCAGVPDSDLAAVLRGARHLRALCIEGAALGASTPLALAGALRRCPLRHLTLRRVDRLDDGRLAAVLGVCTALRTLTLDGVRGLSDAALVQGLGAVTGSRLEVVELRGPLPGVGVASLYALSERCAALRELIVDDAGPDVRDVLEEMRLTRPLMAVTSRTEGLPLFVQQCF